MLMQETLRDVGSNTPVFLPGEFHGQRSLAGYGLWGHKELDMAEQLTLLDLTEDIVQKS